ncbi:WXG100 family type VII secretion target [Amphibacillus jilinensis]|uniref:WXG100 family type VII secretion target n=1 Tax=Amphibacillus jilinensis TaxID=1216008 RepID=UPI0002F56714|nr:hypothetical protein [Amphibacillus jilinensis]
MSLQIKVDPNLVESLLKKPQLIANDEMMQVITEIKGAGEALSDWKGEASKAHQTMQEKLLQTIGKNQRLMVEVLETLYYAIDQFEEKDEELSRQFKTTVEYYHNQ